MIERVGIISIRKSRLPRVFPAAVSRFNQRQTYSRDIGDQKSDAVSRWPTTATKLFHVFPAQFSRFTGRNFSSTGCRVARLSTIGYTGGWSTSGNSAAKVSSKRRTIGFRVKTAFRHQLPALSLFLSLSWGRANHSAKTPCCQDFAGELLSRINGCADSRTII